MKTVARILGTLKSVLAAVRDTAVHAMDMVAPGMAKRLIVAWSDESGEIAEKVVIVAVFVALSIAAGNLIYNLVMNKANTINMG